jgi:hypothetical protein
VGYTLAVEDDELVFRNGASVLRGAQLVGAIILVQLSGGVPVPVTIANHHAVPSWAAGVKGRASGSRSGRANGSGVAESAWWA